MNYPMIMVCGHSGTGKSFSLRKLNPQTTRILNFEIKALPFKNEFDLYGNNVQPNTDPTKVVEQLDGLIDAALYDPKIEIVVIESGIKWCEETFAFSKKLNRGWDIYNYYNDQLGRFLKKLKINNGKMVVVTWIDEIVAEITPGGGQYTTRRAATVGKEWEGKIEKEFTIVMFTDVKQEKGKDAVFTFMVNNDGTCSAKSPPDLFGGKQFIDNDMKLVTDKVFEYYNLPRLSTQKVA